MRITLIIAEGRREDALLILEVVGFVREDPGEEAASEKPAKEGRFTVTGELPEKSIIELPAIDGVLDWTILPMEETTAESKPSWPWSQNPETD